MKGKSLNRFFVASVVFSMLLNTACTQNGSRGNPTAGPSGTSAPPTVPGQPPAPGLPAGIPLGNGGAPVPAAGAQSTSPQGTQHIGGGETVPQKSTPVQVHRALDLALLMLQEDDFRVFMGASLSSFFTIYIPSYRATEREKEIYSKLYTPSDFSYDFAISGNLVRKFFFKSKLTRLADGKCPSPRAESVDASVSDHKIGADICIGITSLTKVPPEQLFPQVLALLLHEAVHLLGYDEEDAVRLQNLILKFYSLVLNKEVVSLKRNLTTEELRGIVQNIKFAVDENRSRPGSPRVYALLGRAIDEGISHLTMKHVTFDQAEFALQLIAPLMDFTFPQHPVLFINLFNSAALYQQAFAPLANIFREKQPGSSFLPTLTPSHQPQLEALLVAAENLLTNWYSAAEMRDKPVCAELSFPEHSAEIQRDERLKKMTEQYRRDFDNCKNLRANWESERAKWKKSY